MTTTYEIPKTEHARMGWTRPAPKPTTSKEGK